MRERHSEFAPDAKKPDKPASMEVDIFYELNPPVVVTSGIFRRVQCKEKFPDGRNYLVQGIPDGGTEMKTFVLKFTKEGVKVTRSADQGPDRA